VYLRLVLSILPKGLSILLHFNIFVQKGERLLKEKSLSLVLILLAVFVLSMLTLAFNIQPAKAAPITIIVPDDYPTIQEAINAANSGDTVYVRVGTYVENVVVNKSISLIGGVGGESIIDGNYEGIAVHVEANDVVVANFTIIKGPKQWPVIPPPPAHALPPTGLYLEFCNNTLIQNNLITQNLYGVYIESSSGNTMVGNSIKNNEVIAIILKDSSNNTISGNNIAGTSDGITLLERSSNNTISGNNIAANGGWDIEFWYASSNNIIYHNNFMSKGVNNYDSTNVFDDGYPSSGNYWSSYTGKDLYSGPYQNETGCDGIIDTPYVIDENNQDRYPFMAPWPLKGTVLTVHTSGVSSHSPVTVTMNGANMGTAYDDHPLELTLYDRNTPFTRLLGVQSFRVWSTNPNRRYTFTEWTGPATGTTKSNPVTITLSANSSCTANYETQHFSPISFSNSFKDNAGNALYALPSSFKLTFPNGTVSASLDPSSSYYIQNGTTTWNSIIWQGTEVTPSSSFDSANGNPTVNCKIFSLTVDPVFYDITGTALIQPSSWTIEFPNGTTTTVSSPITYNQTQTGNYSIISVIWKGTEVVPDITPTTSLASDKLWSPSINCLLPTSLTVSLSSSTSYVGFKVEINGNLTYNEVGLSGTPILIFYSVTGGESWNEITLINTTSNGSYSAVWMPSATGNYLVRATWSGNATYPETTAIINLAVIPFKEQNVFSVTSNSTVSELAFNSTSRELSFTVTGPSGTTGYVNIYIAKTLIDNIADVKVYLDGDQLNYTATSLDDSWLLHFTYLHSTHKVTISLGSISAPFIETTFGKAIIYGVLIIIAISILIIFFKRRQIINRLRRPEQTIN
jgi:parallel beta-helix repeat protein